MKIYIKILLGILLINCVAQPQNGIPKVFTVDGKKIYSYREAYLKGELKNNEAVKKVFREAKKQLDIEPLSVVQKKQTPPGGTKHDYTSLSKYWWPNPDTKDGLPYIRKDGEINPETKDISDEQYLPKMINAVEALSLAYYISNDKKYSDKAAELLRVWFLNEDTKMNPNLNYSQFVPGKSEGRGSGIIDTHQFPVLIDAVGMLQSSPSWTAEDDKKLKVWFSQYLDWLTSSKNGKDEAKAKNNHGSWYDYQVISIALFLDKTDMAKMYLEAVKTKRIAVQIKADGTQPLELERTKSWDYSLFNLEALCNLAIVGDRVGVDLWNYENPEGGSIRKALDYVLSYSLNLKSWKYPQIQEFKINALYPILVAAKKYIDIKTYSEWIAKIFSDKMIKDKENILN
jgi:hypothetical protein